jgi:hypothetical protein
VLGFQKAQVRRRELVESLQSSTAQIGQLGKGLTNRVGELEQHLPQTTRSAVTSLRNVAKTQEALLRNVVGINR